MIWIIYYFNLKGAYQFMQILNNDSIASFEKHAGNWAELLRTVAPIASEAFPHIAPIIRGVSTAAKEGGITGIKDVLSRTKITPFEMGGRKGWNIKMNVGGDPSKAGRTMPGVDQMAAASESAPAYARKGNDRFTTKGMNAREANINYHNANTPEYKHINFFKDGGGPRFTGQSMEEMVAAQPKPEGMGMKVLKGVGVGAGLGALGLVGGAAAAASGGGVGQ